MAPNTDQARAQAYANFHQFAVNALINDIAALVAENAALKEQLAAAKSSPPTEPPKP